MKPLSDSQSINIPMPRIQVSQVGQGTPVGELVEKKDLDGLHGSLGNGNKLGNGKPRRRSIPDGMT